MQNLLTKYIIKPLAESHITIRPSKYISKLTHYNKNLPKYSNSPSEMSFPPLPLKSIFLNPTDDNPPVSFAPSHVQYEDNHISSSSYVSKSTSQILTTTHHCQPKLLSFTTQPTSWLATRRTYDTESDEDISDVGESTESHVEKLCLTNIERDWLSDNLSLYDTQSCSSADHLDYIQLRDAQLANSDLTCSSQLSQTIIDTEDNDLMYAINLSLLDQTYTPPQEHNILHPSPLSPSTSPNAPASPLPNSGLIITLHHVPHHLHHSLLMQLKMPPL